LESHSKVVFQDKDKTVIEEGAKGEKKVLVCTLAMNVCEAIMAYLVKTWADNKDQLARKIIPVFKTYTSISDHLKVKYLTKI
jgi:hypothetical protein